jgi:hypothetical protein
MTVKLNQRGFTLIEGLLLAIFLTLIGFTGWYVWDSNNKTDKATDSATVQTTNSQTNKTEPKTTSDKDQIIALYKAKCNSTEVTDLRPVNQSLLSIFGNYATAAVGCEEGGGYRAYLMKGNNGWEEILGTQQEPTCSKLDGKGFPASIVSECYDEETGTMRAPK